MQQRGYWKNLKNKYAVKTFITRGGNKHELVAQGWNHLK